MNIDTIRDYVLQKPSVTEGFPFGDTVIVFKVNGKMFLLLSLDSVPLQFNVKCDPLKAEELREEFARILPGYHMNKKHWNTIVVDRTVTTKVLKVWIDHSYSLVKK